MLPKVIVLILSYNGKKFLGEAIDSYLKNNYGNFKIIVIDNGSTDGTEEFVNKNYPQVSLLRLKENLGYSGGFNEGLKYSFGEEIADYALITNNDVLADENIVDELVKTASTDEKIGFTTGKVYFYNSRNTLQTVGMAYDPVRLNGGHIGIFEEDKGQYDKVEERAFADDIFMLVSRNLYQQTGGYDEEFVLQAEQFDWQIRAKINGFKIMYTPFAKLWHKESMTIGKHSPVKLYYDARNPMIVLLKYRNAEQFRKYFWLHLWKDIARSSLINFKNGHIEISLKIWEGFFSSIFWGFKHKKFTFKHFF
jgi:GT2 family glycosyltransferase